MHRNTYLRRPTVTAAAAATTAALAVITLALAGCAASPPADSAGSSASNPALTSTGTPASGPHNDADIAFAAGMVPHHAQAVEMSELAADRASAADVLDLATRIRDAQAPEIAQMTGWLTGWGAEADATMHGAHAQMDGMMSDEQMSALSDATGTAFDRLWLEQMIEHHTGALDMARTELADGDNPDAQALAQAIVDSQSAEITEMQQLLAQLPTG